MGGTKINLKSSSDGWRGAIADSFTFEFVERVAVALSKYSKKYKSKKIPVAFDTRFLSKEFAMRSCYIFHKKGIKPILSNRPVPTPVLSFYTNITKSIFGISITASHNPYWYNGLKIRMQYGGPCDKGFVSEIQRLLSKNSTLSYKKQVIKEADFVKPYIKNIRKHFDLSGIKNKKMRVMVDTMHGTTYGILKNIFKNTKIEIDELNGDIDPLFGKVAPEPQEFNTKLLQKNINKYKYDLGVAHDGDGDRIMARLPRTGYLSPHDVSAIILWYLINEKKNDGIIIGSVTISRRIKKLAEFFNKKYIEVPIGFRNASKLMRENKVLIACEENGGIGCGSYLPERDATFIACLLIEAQLKYKGGIKAILNNINKIAGKSGFCRLNISTKRSPELILKQLKKRPPKKILSKKISRISNVDGIKLHLENNDWISIRVSGTENLIRIYAESDNNNKAKKLANTIKKWIDGK